MPTYNVKNQRLRTVVDFIMKLNSIQFFKIETWYKVSDYLSSHTVLFSVSVSSFLAKESGF